MRFFLAGLLTLTLSTAAFAQAKGEVESIGFNSYYRPDCWTPMVIRLLPETAKTDTYQIQVFQEDLDRDQPIYTRTITLTGNNEGSGTPLEQRFWMYFLPQPTNQGLADPAHGNNLRDLQSQLKVYLCTATGKQIAPLPITQTIQNLDPYIAQYAAKRGVKLILCVSDSGYQPAWQEYKDAVGIAEDVVMVGVQSKDLPESALGYEAVDAIAWFDADAAELNRGSGEKMRALRQWLTSGGNLVVSEPAEWHKTDALNDLLPVTITGISERDGLDPLKKLAHFKPGDLWDTAHGPYRLAKAAAKTDAVVDVWMDWDAGEKTPFLARTVVGAGAVAWVAQDLADPTLTTRLRTGWPYVWDRVFGWKNDTRLITPTSDEALSAPYIPSPAVDLGASMVGSQLEVPGRAGWLVTLALVFFVAYWLAAGPALYFVLLGRKQQQLNWFLFAATAVVATFFTVLVVKLVVRGPPRLQHVSMVRLAAAEPTHIRSRFGLYIPRDGEQVLEAKDTAANEVSALAPFAIHPQYLTADMGFPPLEPYDVPVRDATSIEPLVLRVPYRSTLKELQARWVGDAGSGIDGSVQLEHEGYISGKLTNITGHDLTNIYFAFRYPTAQRDEDWILFIPSWKNATTLDLAKEFKSAKLVAGDTPPAADRAVKGRIGTPGRPLDWELLWSYGVRSQGVDEQRYDDSNSGNSVRRSIPMLSFFDLLPPVKRTDLAAGARWELLRRGARFLDLSHVVTGGKLAVVADARGPLPFPMNVDGDRIIGDGTCIYQFVVNLARNGLDAEAAAEAATQPAATEPVDEPIAKPRFNPAPLNLRRGPRVRTNPPPQRP